MSMCPSSPSFTTSRFYPVLVILLAAAFLFFKYILQVSPSVITDELTRVFHIDGIGLGNLAASFFYSFLVSQLFVGFLLDKYSPRLLTTLAILLCAVGAYVFSKATHLSLATGARIVTGIGAAFATVSYMKMASLWFGPRHFAFVGGLLASAAMLGAMVGQVPLSLLIAKVGWRPSLALCAGFGAVLAVLFYTLVRDKPNQRQTSVTSNFLWRDLWEVLANKQNWLITLYSGLAFSPIDAFAGLWCIPFLRDIYQLSQTQAAFFASLIFLGVALGSPLLGLFSDYVRQRRSVMFAGGGLALVSISAVVYVTGLANWLLGTLLLLFGLGTGAFMLGFTLGRELNKLSVAATIIALINTGNIVFSAITQPLIGILLDQGSPRCHLYVSSGVSHFSATNYQHALMVLPCYVLLSLVLLYFIREPRITKA